MKLTLLYYLASVLISFGAAAYAAQIPWFSPASADPGPGFGAKPESIRVPAELTLQGNRRFPWRCRLPRQLRFLSESGASAPETPNHHFDDSLLAYGRRGALGAWLDRLPAEAVSGRPEIAALFRRPIRRSFDNSI